MARPRKEGLDYFPHDTDASSDEKIEALRALYGNDGYAFYFILLERIYRTESFEIDVSDAEIRQVFAQKCGVSAQKFDQMLETALKWRCFDPEEYARRGVLTSHGIKKRAATIVEKRRVMRERYEQRVSAAKTGEEMPESKKYKREVHKRENYVPTDGRDAPSPRPRKKYVFTDEHMALAQRLADRMRENKPDVKLPASLDAWADTARLMVDMDKRAPSRIIAVIDWCQRHEFWRRNILSMGKLREQFDRLEMEMRQAADKRGGNNGRNRGSRELPPGESKYDDLVVRDPELPMP